MLGTSIELQITGFMLGTLPTRCLFTFHDSFYKNTFIVQLFFYQNLNPVTSNFVRVANE